MQVRNSRQFPISVSAKTGTTTALVGHSGSGKSTTASLIPRFYDVQEGAVKIGGVDIRDIPHTDLMKMVAFVFQDPKLFKDSLLENIRPAAPWPHERKSCRQHILHNVMTYWRSFQMELTLW